MDEETANRSVFSDVDVEEIRGRMMLISLSALFLSVILVLTFHLYAKFLWWRVERQQQQHQYALRSTTTRRHGTLVFAIGQDIGQAAGLDPFVLRSIPVVTFKQEDFKNGLECVVCLSELIEGEKARVLPNCNHGFHVDCIDMWFLSHSTCPLCRNRVVSSTVTSSVSSEETESVIINIRNDHHGDSQNPILNSGYSMESSNFSIEDNLNGGSLGNNHQATAIPSSGNRTQEQTTLVINVSENVNVNSSSSSSTVGEEDLKFPVNSKTRPLKILLSMEKKVVISSSSSSAPPTDV